ncbi:MAG: hypothetical protein JWL59_2222 [Chthoniobacteraceae bacterium]|nr:hypothetical protein [Chthoniobacteraceae bacterium]
MILTVKGRGLVCQTCMSVSEPVSLPPERGGLPSNVAATLACVFPPIGGLVFLLLDRKNPYVRFYSMQSILFGCAWFVLTVVLRVSKEVLLEIPLLGKLLSMGFSIISAVVVLGALALYVVQIWKAFSGKEWEVPYLGPLARKQLSSRQPL